MEVEAPVRCTGSTGSDSSSPEFEFWMVRNPSLPPPDLLTADELFVDGVLLPLQLLSLPCSERPALLHSNPTGPPAEPTASIIYSSASISRRWKDLFKSTEEKNKSDEKDRRKKAPKSTAGGSADLNINLNIWPFTRSRSAVGRPHSASFIASRKVSSAPCSRSNSNGESTGGMRRGASAGRSASLHLGRSSPVLQLRRAGVGAKEKERLWIPSVSSAGGNGGTAGVRVLNMNVNSCIGFGNQVSSPGEASDEIAGSGRAAEGSSGGNGSIFNLRAVFSKKVL